MKAEALLAALEKELRADPAICSVQNVQKLVVIFHIARDTGTVRTVDMEVATKKELLR